MSKPLKDKNGNIIMCGFNEGKCGSQATKYLVEPLKLSPLCQKHYNYVWKFAKQYESDTITGKGSITEFR